MSVYGVCRCDVPGCATPALAGTTTISVEVDAVFAGWDVVAGVVRCPACVTADRWPTATIGTHPGTLPTTVPWIDGPEQGIAEKVPAPLESGGEPRAATEYRVVTDDDLEI